jgi:hypothetical protein
MRTNISNISNRSATGANGHKCPLSAQLLPVSACRRMTRQR